MEIIYNCSNGGGENIVSVVSVVAVVVGVLSRGWVDTILDLQRCVLRHFFLHSSHCPLFLPFVLTLVSIFTFPASSSFSFIFVFLEIFCTV